MEADLSFLISSNAVSGQFLVTISCSPPERPRWISIMTARRAGAHAAGNAAHGKLQWINSACFAEPLAGELGNAGRVPATGPDFVNTDFSVIKQIGLPREMGLNFRAEFFNLFNHPQFGSPVNDVSSAGFGFVQSTVNNGRLVQLALKLTF